jgi:hypothetical protein
MPAGVVLFAFGQPIGDRVLLAPTFDNNSMHLIVIALQKAKRAKVAPERSVHKAGFLPTSGVVRQITRRLLDTPTALGHHPKCILALVESLMRDIRANGKVITFFATALFLDINLCRAKSTNVPINRSGNVENQRRIQDNWDSVGHNSSHWD